MPISLTMQHARCGGECIEKKWRVKITNKMSKSPYFPSLSQKAGFIGGTLSVRHLKYIFAL